MAFRWGRGIGRISQFQHCPVLVGSFYGEWVEGGIGRSQILSEYRKRDRRKRGKE